MRQILQSLRTGAIELAECPSPSVRPKHLLVQTHKSLISTGTEKMLLEFGKAGWLGKIQQQPDKVRQVFDKIRTDGLFETLQSVNSKLNQPLPLGYSNVGTVVEVGSGAEGFQVGDRVVSNGHHAEVVCVPANLCAKIPDAVSDETATFTVVGSIALQGIRLAQPTLGECFVVTGLGLIGLLTVQLLRAQGCRVLGIDLDTERLEIARQFGAETVRVAQGEDPIETAYSCSRGRGVDGVLITASSNSNNLIHQAAVMCRKRGRIVLVGVVGMQLSRADFYEKELSFQVSCSYGPGRYDPKYEQHGHDYPIGFVRWTAQRNFQAVLDMMAEERLTTKQLVSQHFPIAEADRAYLALAESGQTPLGLVLDYPSPVESVTTLNQTIDLPVLTRKRANDSLPKIGVLGAGAFACRTLIPAFRKHGANLLAIASQNGMTASVAARRFHIPKATTDVAGLLANSDIDTVVIATQHDSHCDLVCRALKAGKHVYVEKPLAMNHAELDRITSTLKTVGQTGDGPILTVGFNRRFAPQIVRIAKLLHNTKEPKSILLTINAGAIPGDSWVHDPTKGGGRIIGEVCHFIDLARYLCGHAIVSMSATTLERTGLPTMDNVTITLRFTDGSVAVVHYLSNGHRGVSKERLEVFCGGKIIQLDNYLRLRAFGWSGLTKMNLWWQDKGHTSSIRAFLDAVREGKPSPIPTNESIEITRVTSDVLRVAQTGDTIQYSESRRNTDQLQRNVA